MRWQSHLRALVTNVGRRVEQKSGGNGALIQNLHLQTLDSIGASRPLKFPPTCIPRPFQMYLQQLGMFYEFFLIELGGVIILTSTFIYMLRISTSRQLLADSDAAPVSSPLMPLIGPSSGKTEAQAAVAKPDKVKAVLKGIKQSPKKLNLVAAVVRGMRVEDALLQMQVTVKRAAKTVYQVIHSAQANATHNHGLNRDRLVVAEAYVGKGLFKKRVSYHGRGRSGIMHRPVSRLTVVVREMTPEEEAQLAKLRVHNFHKLTKKERRLVPHTLIESNPVWGRKNKAGSDRTPSMA